MFNLCLNFKTGLIVLVCLICFGLIIPSCTFTKLNHLSESYKEKIIDDMYFILSPDQLHELSKLDTREDIDNFIDEFWKNLDPNLGTPENEIKNEFEKRLEYANQKYKNPYGWGRSDRKRIYILYGPPDFIDYANWTDINFSTARRFKSMEIWVYNNPARYQNISTIFDNTYPLQMKFIFVDSIGSGVYYLIYNTEEMDYIDPYVFQEAY